MIRESNSFNDKRPASMAFAASFAFMPAMEGLGPSNVPFQLGKSCKHKTYQLIKINVMAKYIPLS